MGKDRISSQEIADYTNINATQIRRDLSNFGKFGKRGVGYNDRRAARRDPEDPAHAGPAQHRARRRRPARPGDRELADLRRARDQHRRRLRHRPEQDRALDRRRRGQPTYARLKDVVRDKNIIVGVLAVPAAARAAGRGRSRRRGREDHLQLLRGAARRARRRHGAHVEPGGRAAPRALLPPDLATRADPPLARVPARRHRVERLHAGARAGVEPRRARRDGGLPGARTRSATTSAARAVVAAGAAGRAAARVRARPLRGARGAAAPGLHARRSATRYVEANAAALRELAAGRPRLREPRPAGRRRSAPRRARRSAVKAHGSELEYSMRGRPELERVGRARRSRRADAVFVGSEHIREVLEEVVGHVERVLEVPPGVDVDEFVPGAARRGARRRCSRRRAPTRRTRATRTSGCPTRATPRGSSAFLARRRADRRLLREADREQGRPPAARGARAASTRAR